MNYDWAHTGLDGLDEILQGLRKGDNVVWQINRIEAYHYFVKHFAERAISEDKRLVYIRFAHHKSLLDMNNPDIEVYKLNADMGFESFASEVHNIITKEGRGVYYVFDCLSDLLYSWATDLMIGNFFVVVCPYLFELDTIAYFGIFREKHSFKTIGRIQDTTQLLLDLYQEGEDFYLHPVKVWNRYSPTMFLPHLKEEKNFLPVTSSYDASHLFSNILNNSKKSLERSLDYWDRLFWDAGELDTVQEQAKIFSIICRLMLTRDERLLSLIEEYFTLEDLLDINIRLIGTGFIGGKSLGMLLARNILRRSSQENDNCYNLSDYLEEHDSFYIGSDVFYTYIVQNGWWKLRLEQKSEEGYYKLAGELKEKLLTGKFPDEIKDQFHSMLDYFGQSPIIIRSSSLLEDGYGNAFAGKYDSFFCVNQGTPEERYRQFEDIVRKVYASSMNEDALVYRKERGLSERDEQMALLVQRVSGKYRGNYFFPDAAGVGVSYNTFAWNKELDPEAGMLRLVFGLGTRAVNRVEGDYPRIVALDNLQLQSYSNIEDQRRYSQHKVDLLDISSNSLETFSIAAFMGMGIDLPQMNLFGQADQKTIRRIKKLGIKDEEPWIINFQTLLLDTEFPEIMQAILKQLEKAYQYPVDIEFTVNITDNRDIRINLVQCRPLQVRGRKGEKSSKDSRDKGCSCKDYKDEKDNKSPTDYEDTSDTDPEDNDDRDKNRKDKGVKHKDVKDSGDNDIIELSGAESQNILFSSKGNFMGGSYRQRIRRVIYVHPEAYNDLLQYEKYNIARLIGKINRLIDRQIELPMMLIGPGRWGTSTPALGVPVRFSEINHVSILMEVAYYNGNLVPELSFGSHFFQDLVETNIGYIALFPEEEGVFFDEKVLLNKENKLIKLIPGSEKYEGVIHVCDLDSGLLVAADLLTQEVSGNILE
ncbi:MAG: PEP/pyruvate-binding domain-containing protein [Halanaerobiales bacterium]